MANMVPDMKEPAMRDVSYRSLPSDWFDVLQCHRAMGVIAIFLGIKLPSWMGLQRYRLLSTAVLVPLMFVAPVADEIIAWPQMQASVFLTEALSVGLWSGHTECTWSNR